MTSVAQVTSYPRRAVRALIVAQFATIGAFLTVLLLYVGRMTSAGVGPAEMLTGAYDPKDMVPFGTAGLNPFLWLYAVVGVLYLTGAVLALPLAIVAVALVAREREALPRAIRSLLLAGAVGGLLVLVARFTPPLLDMHRWWLD
ncbi:hypothetical protein [Micromonospora saelicesensis]|uniref:Uncharacterized protein n=1 Tax=Micromonospora saelicesensis TaxID=285676 RepID=A0A1C4UVY7_9ACTN|nr:hypothetical protein [Micromonospora saelicesensis]RAO61915.1 hypothetical protein PSN01_01405 [Micromonospora saelicesensis]SCE75811.1 hypothetical protein GA0070561_1411 [Micromonospora saelicesensis]